jgi:hypothetical protein
VMPPSCEATPIYVDRVPTGLPHRNRRRLFEGLAAIAVVHAEAGKTADQIGIYVVQHLARFGTLTPSAVHEVAAAIGELSLSKKRLRAAWRARSALEQCAESLEEA